MHNVSVILLVYIVFFSELVLFWKNFILISDNIHLVFFNHEESQLFKLLTFFLVIFLICHWASSQLVVTCLLFIKFYSIIWIKTMPFADVTFEWKCKMDILRKQGLKLKKYAEGRLFKLSHKNPVCFLRCFIEKGCDIHQEGMRLRKD